MRIMKERLSDLREWLKAFREKTPEKIKAFNRMVEAIEEEGALSKKDKELMAIALSITQECEWCVAAHVNGALKASATEEEVLEAAWMAVLMGGGPALMYSGLVLDALEDFSD